MIRVCSWCGITLGVVVAPELPPDTVTNGMCGPCYKVMRKRYLALKVRQFAGRPACQRRARL
jgi:hypothetical protein